METRFRPMSITPVELQTHLIKIGKSFFNPVGDLDIMAELFNLKRVIKCAVVTAIICMLAMTYFSFTGCIIDDYLNCMGHRYVEVYICRVIRKKFL